MVESVTVRRIGNSLGVLLPKSELDNLGVGEGDKLFVIRTPRGIRLTPFDPDFVKVIEATRGYMRRHRDALKELAK